ncbi:hypothetical protein ACFLUS_03505 [Chloroflexota bacterium]
MGRVLVWGVAGLTYSGKDPRPEWLPGPCAGHGDAPGRSGVIFTFNEEVPANLLFLVHVKHLFPPVSEVSSSIPDSPDPVGVFSPVTLPSGVGAFYPSIYTTA